MQCLKYLSISPRQRRHFDVVSKVSIFVIVSTMTSAIFKSFNN